MNEEEKLLREKIMKRIACRFYHSEVSTQESDYDRWRFLFEDDCVGILNDRPDLIERYKFPQHEEEVLFEIEHLLCSPLDLHPNPPC